MAMVVQIAYYGVTVDRIYIYLHNKTKYMQYC